MRLKVSGIAEQFMPIMTSAIAIKSSDIKGTSMDAILPIRLIPPIITIAAKNATTAPIMSFIHVASFPMTDVNEPTILLFCTPLIPAAASRQKIAAIMPSHFCFIP